MDLFFISVLAVIVVLGLLGMRKFWHSTSSTFDGVTPGWWVWGDTLFRAWRRGLPVATAGALFLTVTLLIGTLGEVEGRDDNRSQLIRVMFTSSAIVTLVSFVLALAIFLFNRPRVLVPPRYRNEAGIVSDVGRRLRRSPRA